MKLKPIASNMSELHFNNETVVLFSYQTPVAALIKGQFFRTTKKWSVTTSKHINRWIGGSKYLEMDQSKLDGLVE
jgi:hypothetical protein